MNGMILDKIIERAAMIYYYNYKSIEAKDCINMAIGEAEVRFDTDFNLEITQELCDKVMKKSERRG